LEFEARFSILMMGDQDVIFAALIEFAGATHLG
jgi:hypothetical protein